MSETIIITLVTSIFAPAILLILQRVFSKLDKKNNIAEKIDKLDVKIDKLSAENKGQNERLDKLEHNIDKINNAIQVDRKVNLKFMQLQTQMDKSLMVELKKAPHNGDIVKAEASIEQFEQLIESDIFKTDRNTI